MGKNVVKAAGWLLIINACVKLAGFVREMVIANGFGASAFTDAYQAAYTLPYFLQSVLGFAMVSAVLPTLSRYWRQDGDNREGCRIASTLINIVAAGMLLISVLGIVFAPQLVWLTAPELPAETATLAAQLARIMFPSVLFMSVGMVMAGVLNHCYRFTAAAVAPGVCSLVIMVATAFFAHGRIEVVAWGTLLGFVAFLLVTAVDLPHTGLRYCFAWDLRHPAIRRVLIDLLPILLGLAVNQIYTIINRIFASGLAIGSISALNYANKLINLPQGVFVAAISTAIFPALAEQAQQKDPTEFHATIRRGLTMVLLVALPATCGLLLLNTPIVSLLFESGEFDAAATGITAYALLTMCPGLVFLSLNMLLVRVFYAVGDVWTPLITGGLSIGVNVLVSVLFVPALDHGALGLANSAAAAVNALLRWLILARRLHCFRNSRLCREVLLICAAAAAMCVPVWACARLVPPGAGKMTLALWVVISVVVGIAVYLLVLKLCRSASLQDLKANWRRSS